MSISHSKDEQKLWCQDPSKLLVKTIGKVIYWPISYFQDSVFQLGLPFKEPFKNFCLLIRKLKLGANIFFALFPSVSYLTLQILQWGE